MNRGEDGEDDTERTLQTTVGLVMVLGVQEDGG